MESSHASAAAKSRRRRWWQFSLRGLFLLVTLCGVALYVQHELGWQRKKALAQRWAVIALEQDAKSYSPFLMDLSINPNPLVCPEPLEMAEQLEVLHIGITSLPETEHRVACLKLLVKLFPHETHVMLRRVVAVRNPPDVRVSALRILSLFRQPRDVDVVLPCLKDNAAEVRAAAADCLGIIHRPAYEIPWNLLVQVGGKVTEMPVEIPELFGHFPADGPIDDRKLPQTGALNELSPEVRQAIERLMLDGETTGEREAAARALVFWPPPNYKLRVAEWGVWLDDGGELKLVQSVIDEIPEFVHRTYNSADSFHDRVVVGMVVSKPILHLTVDRPLAVDIDVSLRWGRPWFAYPRPDDFSTQVGDRFSREESEPSLAKFDRPEAPNLEPLVEGFPWMRRRPRHGPPPSHPIYGILGGLGLRWQSVVVSPTQLPWMTPPALGDDERFAWWSELRKVPSSWVSSQGETERFLYYDGPTLARSPLAFGFTGRVLSWHERDMFEPPEQVARSNSFASASDERLPPVEPPVSQVKKPRRTGFFIQVTDGQLAVRRLDFAAPAGSAVVNDAIAIEGDTATQTFQRMLTDYGLTPDEAGGLFRAWEKQFFHTDGTRLITLLLRSDYDRLCPLTVRPQPTEIVRLGLLLTEFDAPADSR